MAVELPILKFVRKYNFFQTISAILRGGVGPGSYYTPIMIEMIFIAPLVYFIVKKYDFKGTLICFLFTALFEAVAYIVDLPSILYKLLAFRYVSILAFGCYIAIGKRALKRGFLIAMFVIGIAWQTMLNYIPLHPLFMNNDWARVNYLSSMFVLPVMYVLVKKYGTVHIKMKMLQEIGKASYNIFLVQMVFYSCGPASIVYRYVDSFCLQLIVCIVLCVFIGYVFFGIEHRITGRCIMALKKVQK